jgi:hypothetical protein
MAAGGSVPTRGEALAPFIGRAIDRRRRRGDEGRDATVLRRSSTDARTAGLRTDRQSAACATRIRRGDGEARGAGQSRRLGARRQPG